MNIELFRTSQGDDPCQMMMVNNVTLHLSLHAANAQQQSLVHHTTQQTTNTNPSPGPSNNSPQSATTATAEDIGYAGEIELWGTIPNWSEPDNQLLAEVLACRLVAQYARGGSLSLSEQQKHAIQTVVGVDEKAVGSAGIVVSLRRS